MKTRVLFAILVLATATLGAEDFRYIGTCDASAAVSIGTSYMLVADDETDILRLYKIGSPRRVGRLDLTADLREERPEADIEGACRVLNSPVSYWITSHGRNAEGKLRPDRHRFFGLLLEAGANSAPTIRPIGQPYKDLARDLVERGSWERPDSVVIETLTAATRLSEENVDDLAPKKDGLNIEGLATSSRDNRLLIGFRNPLVEGKALIVDLLNPEEVLYGRNRARFGSATLLDLNGLGIRAIEYSPRHGGYLIVAGPAGEQGLSSLAFWSGDPDHDPVSLGRIESGPGMNPETIVVADDGRLQLLFDEGSRMVGNKECKDLPDSRDRSFSVRDLDLKIRP